jgi:hypothetical protein
MVGRQGHNFKGKRPEGAGRKKGSGNKIDTDIKKMIQTALNNKGGHKYLERQADENPVAFMGLVGKILPKNVTVDNFTLPPVKVTFVSSDGKPEDETS